MNNATMRSIMILASYTLRESLKNKILWIAVCLSIIGIAGVSFISDFALIESRETEAGLLGGVYRFGAVFAMIVLVVSTMVREFNDKCLELYFSLPISRVIYFFGKLSGFFAVGAAIALVYAAAMLLYADADATALWMFTLICELVIISTLSFFCVLTFNQQVPASVMTASFFYLLCRVSDDLILISQSELLLYVTSTTYLDVLIKSLVVILPSLARFAQSDWLMYNDAAAAEVLPLVLGETLIYTVLLSGAALFDLSRKNL